MTTKEWLNRGRKIDSEIKALLKARQSAYDMCISTTSTLKGDVVASDNDPHAKLERLSSLNLMIDQQVDELIDIKQEILDAILKIDNATYRILLTERYVNVETWGKTAESINYSYSQTVKFLHPEALHTVKCAIECHTPSVIK